MAIITKSKTEREEMRAAGALVAEILAVLTQAVRPGMTTAELDALAARELKRHGATSNFKGYHGGLYFPGTICASVNEEVVHGIPGPRVLKEGDIISIDFGAVYQGWNGDSATTVPVGKISPEAERLLRVTQEALQKGIEQARAGKRVQDIGRAVQQYVEAQGFSVVRQYVGHGIGREMHEEPQVPNYVDEHQPNPQLLPGMVIAIEPMVNAGRAATRVLADKWTVVTADRSLSAHFEHTVAITDGAPDILTLPRQ
ncbi:MAG TPA: type I methionyl aminopeptidase [Ktedonobacterales bacterium]|nr:type I methionyl aminopeptidase [Ktedonobacterales bacterium]